MGFATYRCSAVYPFVVITIDLLTIERKGVLHRDLTSGNILITEDYNVKISGKRWSRDSDIRFRNWDV
jgi:hypothetical protein